MKNLAFCIVVVALSLVAEVSSAQIKQTQKTSNQSQSSWQDDDTDHDHDDDDHSPRVNWYPRKGNVGLGMPKRNIASERLEVIGNVKVSQTIFAHTLEFSSSIKGGTLSLSGNGIINGYLGLGVASPTERLDVLGNIKLSGNLSAQGLNIQTLNSNGGIFNTLTVNQSSIFNGPSSFSENVSFSKDAFVTGKLSTGQFTVSGLASFSENASFAKDLTISGKLGIGVPSPSESLDINGNLKLTGGATIGGNASVSNLAVTGTLHTTSDAVFGQNLNVTGTTQLEGDLMISGQLNAQAISLTTISTSGGATIGNGLAVTGSVLLNGSTTVNGNSSVSGNLQVGQTLSAGTISTTNIEASGNATLTQNLSVNGQSQFGSDVAVAGKVTAGVIEATEFRTTGGGSPFNFENAVISQTLAVGTDRSVPSNYKIAVGGNIIATGIDIKIPQKWPDYVFTDGHKLLTIEEVDAFVKAHGHLPGVLSAEEMEKQQNYSVSGMDAKLMEKIEELTLYVIELKKEIEQLKKN